MDRRMKEEHQVREQLDKSYDKLYRIMSDADSGIGSYRRMKGYIDALEWVIEE